MLRYNFDSKGVEKALQEMRIEMPTKIVDAVDKAIDSGIKSAKYLVPKDTRKLKNSIVKDGKTKVDALGVTGSYSALATNPRNGHNYGFYQEVGWTDSKGRFHEGKFYMKRSKEKAEKVFIKECNQILGRYARK